MFGDQPVIRYMYAYDDSTPERLLETYKVYHHVFGPKSGKMITKGAGGKYTHHRGLYVGWMRTKFEGTSLDFWHCRNGAHVKHIKLTEMQADEKSGSMTAEIHWNDKDGKPVVRELRTLTVTRPQADTWQIDWQTALHSQRGKIEFDGDRQHAGFQFRAAQNVADKNSARYLRPDGFPQQAEAFQVNDKGNPPKHINLNWLGMTYPLEGSQYTIGYFEAPGQPQPSLYSERPYGRFGAFFKTTIEEDKPLEMRYRVRVTEGETPTAAQLKEHYEAFCDELSGTTKS